MEFLRLEADDYESALRRARKEWGGAVRVHTRRNIVGPRGVKRCEITFYLVDLAATVRFEPRAHLDRLLEANAISAQLPSVKALQESCEQLQYAEIEVRLIEALFGPITYGGTVRGRFIHVVGAAAVTTSLPLAIFYRAREGRRVALLAFGPVAPSLSEEATRLALPLLTATDPTHLDGLLDACAAYERVLILGELPPHLDLGAVHTIAVVDASSLGAVQADALLVTGLAEARHAGQLLSYLHTHPVAFSFVRDSDGAVHGADSSVLLRCLTGFTLELGSLSFS